MPHKDSILNLPGFTIKKVSGYLPLVLDVYYRRKARCTFCQGKQIRKKSSFIRNVKHEAVGHRPMILRFKAYKFYCHSCHRYFNQQFPGIGKHQRATERLQNQIFHKHAQGISGQTLAHNFRLGKATVERWFHQRYLLENQETLQKQCSKILGLDEHSFSKKKGDATTFCDLAKHNIFDVVPGKSSTDLSGYLNNLPGKERVKVVCIDLSTSYRNIVRQYFHNAMIVADRFHVIRLVYQMAMQTYQSIDP